MKRIGLLLFLLGMFLFPMMIYAENVYQNVKITASFEESIDLTNLNEIYLIVEDLNELEYELTLKKSENYQLNLSNVPVGTLKVMMTLVKDDILGKFAISNTIKYNNETDAEISLFVTKPNVTTSSTTTSNIKTTQTITTEEDDIRIPIIDDEEVTKTTSTATANDKENNPQGEIEKNKDIEKQERIQQKNKVYKVLFIIVGICLGIGLIYVGFKISRANR